MKTYIPESLIRSLKGLDKTFVVATTMELAQTDSFYPVLHTGVGRMNVYSALVRWWDSARYTIDPATHVLVHFGTAASRRFDTGSLVVANTFVNGGSEMVRDTIRTASSGEPETVVYSSDQTLSPQGMAPEAFNRLLALYDLFDTDAYAFARFCQERHLRRICIKGIADNMDGSVKQWHHIMKSLHRGYVRLSGML